MHKKSIIAHPTWEEQSTLETIMIIVLVVTLEKHVSSVGGGMKKYFFRELSRSRCEEETWDFTNVAKSTSVASYLESWFKVSWFSSLQLHRLDDNFLSSITNTIYFLVTYYTLLTPNLVNFLRVLVGAPHINLQSKTWNISKSKQHYYLVKIYR